ncbi:unnamed protein product [Paramecium sonneborni]|uniref:Uncharacterized protein n=1 Tax=Paramecium sonneborni TaxID=65129 RepID=A0A8S1QF75_9CILI|nr:unnamed protein product [Paramecium sonneborni]
MMNGKKLRRCDKKQIEATKMNLDNTLKFRFKKIKFQFDSNNHTEFSCLQILLKCNTQPF